MSLYRTYRPRTLDDLVGQRHVITVLQQAIAQDRLSHAYLLAGTRGTGKTSTARILARHLLTRGIEDDIKHTQLIKAFEEGSLVDFVEIDAASNTGVDNMRDLIEKIQFTPVVAAAKVYVIDEVHMLSKGAFNALLKTLEEPPSYAFFILATTELHKIPATVQSRCQRFLFRQINENDLTGRLRFIADQEQIRIDDDALLAIARAAQGGMRDAISLLDQLRSLRIITMADVAERTGETGHAFVDQIVATLASGTQEDMLRITRALEETGIALDVFVRLLLGTMRDRLHAAVAANTDISAAQKQIETLLECAADLRSAPVPGLVLESALLSLMQDGEDTKRKTQDTRTTPPAPQSASHEQRATSNEITNQRTNEISSSNNPESRNPNPEIRIPNPHSPLSLETMRSHWPSVLTAIQPAGARMAMQNGQLHALDGTVLTVRFSSNFHREKASTPDGIRSAQQALEAALGQRISIRTVLDSDLAVPPPPPQQAVDLADAVGDIFE